MNSLVFRSRAWHELRTRMLLTRKESAAIVLARATKTPMGNWRLLVEDALIAENDDCAYRTEIGIQLNPEFLVGKLKRARNRGLSIFLVHTHPCKGAVVPSPVDVEGERVLLPTLFNRVPNVPHGRLIIGDEGYNSVLWETLGGGDETVKIIDVGRDLFEAPTTAARQELSKGFDRQVRAFGVDGQFAIQALRVTIVGCGGTGSVVAQQLAHLGVKRFLLIDPDTLEQTNLNRVVGTKPTDVGRLKVEVTRDMINAVNPAAEVETVADSVLKNKVALRILDSDLFFCCTDSHGSRAVLNQLAYQYLMPGIDLGVQIQVKDGKVTHITGRVQMLAPGLSCLVCNEILNPTLVRRDLMTESEIKADPYIVGANEIQPAVISFNSQVASAAVSIFLSAVAGIPVNTRYQVLRAESGTVRSIENSPVPNCIVCSASGALGRAHSWQLPGFRE